MSEDKKVIDHVPQEVYDKIPDYIAKYTAGIYDGQRYRDFEFRHAVESVALTYKFSDLSKPAVVVAENPYEAQLIFETIKHDQECLDIIERIYESNKTGGYDMDLQRQLEERLASIEWKVPATRENDYVYTLNIYGNCYFGWYKFLQDEVVNDEEVADDLNAFNDAVLKSGIYSAICANSVCVVSKYPLHIYVDEQWALHNPEGVAVEWAASREFSEFKCYYLHGREVEEEFFLKVLDGGVTREEFIGESNEEKRAFMYEILGDEKVADLLGTYVVDEKHVKHGNGDDETIQLIKTRDSYEEIGNEPFAWVKYICPSTEQVFYIPCEPKHTDALEAAASQSPLFDVDEYRFDVRT